MVTKENFADQGEGENPMLVSTRVGAQNLLPYKPIYVGSGLGQNLPCVDIRLAQNLPCVEFRPAPNLPPQARTYPCVDFGLAQNLPPL